MQFKSLLVLPQLALTLSAAVSAQRNPLDPSTFKSLGLVAIGQFPASQRDSNNETLGGLGSAAGLVPGSFRRLGNKYQGALYLQPDRGYNVESTIDYTARHHRFDFEFEEYNGTEALSFEQALKRFSLEYRSTTLYHEAIADNRKSTGLNPTLVRTGGLTGEQSAAAPLPAANGEIDNSKQKISIDSEGIVANADGTFWFSDEYGPYIYKAAADGTILAYIAPPPAVVPRQGNQVNFTATVDGTSGRAPNQGFEGLAASFDRSRLFAMLQGATIQDGNQGAKYLRIFEYDISALAKRDRPDRKAKRNAGERAQLVGEYVVQVPTSKKGKARGVSELVYLGPTTLGLLVRDGNGFGDSETDASYKHVDVIDLSNATNVANTAVDAPTGSVAPHGVLDAGIRPAAYSTLVDYLADLPRFGMHAQDDPVDPTLIAAKLESLVLLPTLPGSAPNATFNADEFFILSVSDNDFQTKQGYMRAIGEYAAAYPVDVPTQVFVFKVRLPGVDRGALLQSLGL